MNIDALTLALFLCPIFPIFLIFLGGGVGILQERYFISYEKNGSFWVPATAVGMTVGYLIGLAIILDMGFFPDINHPLILFTKSWILPFFIIGAITSLFQIWSFKRREGAIFLLVAWSGSMLGAILGGIVDFKIQHIGWNCCSESAFAYTFYGFWVHALIVIAVYLILTSGFLHCSSNRKIRTLRSL